MKTNIALFSLLISFTFTFAQKEGNIWYFGSYAGLDFNSGSPVVINDGQLSTFEGCATIADANGDLLFYTDGSTLYDKNHSIMPNGWWLQGNSSSTQSGIIVKKPGSNTIYYVFTVDGITGSSGGFYYSEVDMSMRNGLGDVNAQKNIQIFPRACEKVTAILHANGRDFWIVSPPDNSGSFHSYLLTSSGLDLTPVVSNIGSTYDETYGYLKASPDGKKIAACWMFYSTFESEFTLYDFDNQTGQMSNDMIFTNFASDATSLPFWWVLHPYGIEFSSNGRYLYVADESTMTISQYDIKVGSQTNIANSQILLVNDNSIGGGALQLGPDNKIYAASRSDNGDGFGYGSNYLSVINSPNMTGADADFEKDAIFLGEGRVLLGLPVFYSSIFQFNAFHSLNFCLGDSTFFEVTNTSFDSIQFNFGDPSTGVNNFSGDTVTHHVFSKAGVFEVTLRSYINGTVDSTSSEIIIHQHPILDLEEDTFFCEGEHLLLDLTLADASYLWQDNSTEPILEVTEPGVYWVEVIRNECSSTDSITAQIEDCEVILEVPNIFTPNDDGVNDEFVPIESKGIVDIQTDIYNRWGEKIHTSQDLLIEWKALDVNDGTYFWHTSYTDKRGHSHTQKGHVAIVR